MADRLFGRGDEPHTPRPWPTGDVFGADGRAVVLAADHRARGIITVERYADFVTALLAAAPYCDAVMATAQPLEDLRATGSLRPDQATLLCLNRTGLAGSAFELDDRLIATCERAAREGYAGIKLMTRIDPTDPHGADALELLGAVLEEARDLGLAALIEPLTWTDGRIDRTPDGVVRAAVIAHDMGAPLHKVPVPEATAGSERIEAVRRVVESVGVPVLFLGGPHTGDRAATLSELADAMAAGAAGVAIGRTVYQDRDPGFMARLVQNLVHAQRPAAAVVAEAAAAT
jgi:DhnA family fructose-bisphosphate aldolase class Ia